MTYKPVDFRLVRLLQNKLRAFKNSKNTVYLYPTPIIHKTNFVNLEILNNAIMLKNIVLNFVQKVYTSNIHSTSNRTYYEACREVINIKNDKTKDKKIIHEKLKTNI